MNPASLVTYDASLFLRNYRNLSTDFHTCLSYGIIKHIVP